MTEIRGITGVCPQHNILFDDLSCCEHLEFFGAVKGVDPKDLESQVSRSRIVPSPSTLFCYRPL